MIGGLVSKKPGKVDIRHREGTKNEELTLEITLGVHRSHRMGKDRKGALEERWLHHGEIRECRCQDKRLHRNLFPLQSTCSIRDSVGGVT